MPLINSVLNMLNNSIATVGSTDKGVAYLMEFAKTITDEMSDQEVYARWCQFKRTRSMLDVRPVEYWAQLAMERLMLSKLPEDVREVIDAEHV